MQFLDVKTDFAFKKVFGSNGSKDILISFLNSVIDFGQGEKIADLTIVDPYQIPLLKGMKDSYVDVKARLSNNKHVIIEMQVLNVEGFEKRVLYNAAKAYSAQLMKPDTFSTLEPIIALTITDFIMFDVDKVITYFKLLEKDELIKYNDEIELIFIELPKFKKEEDELTSITDKWIYFIKNAGGLEYTPKRLTEDAEIKKAFEIANIANMSREEFDVQWKQRDFILCQKGLSEFALKQGMEQGIEQGREEGKKEGKKEGLEQGMEAGEKKKAIEIAKTLLSFGNNIERVSIITGLTIEEIAAVQPMHQECMELVSDIEC